MPRFGPRPPHENSAASRGQPLNFVSPSMSRPCETSAVSTLFRERSWQMVSFDATTGLLAGSGRSPHTIHEGRRTDKYQRTGFHCASIFFGSHSLALSSLRPGLLISMGHGVASRPSHHEINRRVDRDQAPEVVFGGSIRWSLGNTLSAQTFIKVVW